MGMSTKIHGQDVPVEIAFGICHQIVRQYDASVVRGYGYPAGTTSQGLPWFTNFRQAVDFLESKPFAGYIQSYVMKEDGSGPSWVTAGFYYIKEGRKDGPVACIDMDMTTFDKDWYAIKHLASSVMQLSERELQARFELSRLDRQDESEWPECFRQAVADADIWCCSSILAHVTDGTD